MSKEIKREKVINKIEEIRKKNLGKVGEIIINILKELLEE